MSTVALTPQRSFLMNKKHFLIVLSLLTFGILLAQNVFAFGSMDFEVGVSDGFSGSQNSLQIFKQRFNEIENDKEFRNIGVTNDWESDSYFGSYAGSEHSLQEFMRRFNEIANDKEFCNIGATDDLGSNFYFGGYAESKYSLQEFKRRFSEIANDREFRNMGVTDNWESDFYF